MEAYKDVPGGHLMDALEKTGEWRQGAQEPETERAKREEIDNTRSMEQLQQMMRGVR